MDRYSTLAVALGLLTFAGLQFSTSGLVGTDGYYHSKLALVYGESGLTTFDWLPLTVLGKGGFVDHHFLFHLLLTPLTIGFGALLGGKFGAIALATLAFIAFIAALPKLHRAELAAVAIAFFVVCPPFLYRLSMVRAQSLSLALLFVLWIALRDKKLLPVFLLSAVYVLAYNAFPLAIFLTGAFIVADWLLNKQLDPKPLLACVCGILLGLIAHPHFPSNIEFLGHHLIDKLRLENFAVRVGREWYPYSFFGSIKYLGASLAALFVSLGLFSFSKKYRSREVLSLLLFSALTAIMALQSRRFVELFPPFALLTFAWCCAPHLKLLFAGKKRSAATFVIIIALSGISLLEARRLVQRSAPPERYRGASVWLSQFTEKGSLVFNADWDDFPRLFFYNANNQYVLGLDPYFLYAQDAELFESYRNITRGKVERPSEIIARNFGARWIFLDSRHKSFEKQLELDDGAILRYRDDESRIYEVATKP